jgi:arylformamidase
MKIYDVTVAVSENVPIYEGDPRVSIKSVKTISGGDNANVSHLCLGAHTGTHVDAPNHFIEGTRRVEELEIEKLVGRCRVIEVGADVMAIEPSQLTNIEGVE